jgi:inositol phosphorylceramide synthase catalytic subunit
MKLRAHLRELGAPWTHWTVVPIIAWPLFILLRGELRWEFFALIIVTPTLAFLSKGSRRLYVGVYPLALTAILYDSMRFVKNAGITPDRIHVCDLRGYELMLFGVNTEAGRVTLQDYFLVHSSSFADLYFAVPYGTFIYVSVLFAVYLFWKDITALQRYTWTFLFMNIAAFATYHIYPAAPPWYYHLTHSCVADMTTHASEGVHLAHVDSMIGFAYFHSFYGRSMDVFGAVPSLHVAYPLLILWEGWRLFGPIRRAIAIIFAASMCCAAVYLDHHYVIDVLLGIVYATTIYLSFRALFARRDRAREAALDSHKLPRAEPIGESR